MSGGLKDIPKDVFINYYAEFLEKSGQINIPSWIEICKSSSLKKYSPNQSNWIFKRMASIIIKFYIYKKLGTRQLVRIYNGKKKR